MLSTLVRAVRPHFAHETAVLRAFACDLLVEGFVIHAIGHGAHLKSVFLAIETDGARLPCRCRPGLAAGPVFGMVGRC